MTDALNDSRKFHPAFEKATEEHKARRKPNPASCFWEGQSLRVIGKGKNTITVSFFDGRQTAWRVLEVVEDDQHE